MDLLPQLGNSNWAPGHMGNNIVSRLGDESPLKVRSDSPLLKDTKEGASATVAGSLPKWDCPREKLKSCSCNSL